MPRGGAVDWETHFGEKRHGLSANRTAQLAEERARLPPPATPGEAAAIVHCSHPLVEEREEGSSRAVDTDLLASSTAHLTHVVVNQWLHKTRWQQHSCAPPSPARRWGSTSGWTTLASRHALRRLRARLLVFRRRGKEKKNKFANAAL